MTRLPPDRDPAAAGRSWLGRLATFFRLRARTWGIQVPLHLVAFLGLFVIAIRLAETAYLEAGAEASRFWMRQLILELAEPEGGPGAAPARHDFEALARRHSLVSFRIYDLEGRALDRQEPPAEMHRIRAMLERQDPESFWLASENDRSRMRGVVRFSGEKDCLPCHEAGQPIGIASISIDFTEELRQIRGEMRRNFALLLVVWALLLGISTSIVRRSAKRLAGRLREDLETADVASGDARPVGPGLVLDPVSQELQRSIRKFLAARQAREAQVVARMAHSDQLASLGRLAAGLAHEIKNPLAGIQGALEILREDLADGDADHELCTQMLEELQRVNQILQLLLTSARPSEPHLRKVDVRELLEEVHRFLEPGIRRRGKELRLETTASPLAARLDAAKIRQVLVNLVENASEAIDGQGRITVRAAPLAEDEGVVITVDDDGPGIPEEHREKIFEPFYTTKFTGTGLGLALARSFIEQHGGTLEVDSAAGTGTRFFVILPGSPSAGGGPTAEPDGP